MSNIAWKTDLNYQQVAPRASRSPLAVVQTPEPRETVLTLPPRASRVPDTAQGTAGLTKPEIQGSPTAGGVAQGPRPTSVAGPRDAAVGNDLILRRVLLGLIGVFSLIIIAEVVFQLGIAPNLTIKTITLDLAPGISEEEVKTALGLQNNLRYHAMDPVLLTNALKSIPAVSDGVVEKRFPDTLIIHATSRTPLMAARVNGRFVDGRFEEGAGQSSVVMDGSGLVFAPASASDSSLPVLSGIDFRNFRIGLKMPELVLPFLKDLEQIRLERPDVYQAFSEFRLMPQGQRTFEVLVYTMASPVPVRINSRLTADNALYILRTMSLLAGHPVGKDVVEVDFRTRNLILRKGDK